MGAFELVADGVVAFDTADLVVTSTSDTLNLDDDEVTLRDAIAAANLVIGHETIDATGISGTITLTEGQLEIIDDVTINGPGKTSLTVDADEKSRVLNVARGSHDVTVSGITLTGGRTAGDLDHGAGVQFQSHGMLTLIDSNITGNQTLGSDAIGGGIYVTTGSVTLTESTVAGNNASGDNGYGDEIVSLNSALILTGGVNWRMTTPVLHNGHIASTADNSASGGNDAIVANLSSVWKNFVQPGDVDNDGNVQASDALRVINELARREFSDESTGRLNSPTIEFWAGIYFDRNGDGKATALDALQIVNDLARPAEGQTAESRAAISNASSNFEVRVGWQAVARQRVPRIDPFAGRQAGDAMFVNLTTKTQPPNGNQDFGVAGQRLHVVATPPDDNRHSAISTTDRLLSDDGFMDDLAAMGWD